MKYDNFQISHELYQTAAGEKFYGNALYVAKGIFCITDEDKSCLDRWQVGTNTEEDIKALQYIAGKIRSSV
jgi:hypothetical protein